MYSENNGTLGGALFALATAIFMLVMYLYQSNLYFSSGLSVFISVFSIAYLCFAISFSLYKDRGRFWIFGAAMLSLMLSMLAVSYGIFESIPKIGATALGEVFGVAVALAIIFPTMVIAMLGFYFWRQGIASRHSKKIGAILVIVAILLFFYYQIYGFGYKGVNVDDETAIAYYSYNAIANGQDPYAISINGILESNATTYGFTPTMNNQIIGYLDYPILFVLMMAPFYYFAHGSAGAIMSSANAAAYLAFIIIAIVIFAASVEKSKLAGFKALIPTLLVISLFFVQIPSVEYSIMLVLLALVFYSIDKWYAFVFLGVAASVQELLWVPVLLAVVYIFADRGFRAGLKTSLGSAAVFLVINAYFIIQGPMEYIRHVFAPISGALVPFLLSPFPYLINSYYPVSINGLEYLFYISIVLGAVAVYATRNKLMIGAMSIMAYFFLYHSLITYAALGGVMIFMALAIDAGNRNWHKKKARRIRKYKAKRAFLSRKMMPGLIAIAMAVFAMAAVALYFHSAYSANFGISATYNGIKNNTYAIVEIKDNGTVASNVSVLVSYSGNGIIENTEGFSASEPAIITNDSDCVGECMAENYINYNILHLHGGKTYSVAVLIPPNATEMRCLLYTDDYFYECPRLMPGMFK